MDAGMRFPATAVLQHATAVTDASDQMARARAAVREVTMASLAYGELCQFLPAMLSPVFGSAVEVLNDAMDAMRETAYKLQTTVEAVEAADVESARRLSDAARPDPQIL
jgi:hypothetical protein